MTKFWQSFKSSWKDRDAVVNQIREAVRATHLSARFAKKSLKPRLGREKYKEYRELERRLAQKCGENCMVMRSTWLRNTISGSLSSTGIFHCSPSGATIPPPHRRDVIQARGIATVMHDSYQKLFEGRKDTNQVKTSSHWRSICCSTLTRTNYQ